MVKHQNLIKNKDKKKNKEKDVFDNLFSSATNKQPRHSVVNIDMAKQFSDPKKSQAFFGSMKDKGDANQSSDEDEDYKILEEENRRLKSLIEYKDIELSKRENIDSTDPSFISDIRLKYDLTIRKLEEQIQSLERTVNTKDREIIELQTELNSKTNEFRKATEKHAIDLQQQQFECDLKMEQMGQIHLFELENTKEGLKKEIEEHKNKLVVYEKEKNKLLDEKLKVQSIIDTQLEQIDYWNNRALKAEEEVTLRRKFEEDVTKNLRKREEEIRQLRLEKEEKIIKSFAVKFFNIEESKNPEEATTKGKVQT